MRGQVLLLGAASLTSVYLGLAGRSDGPLSLVLPWLGAAVYAGLAAWTRRRPDDPRLAWGMAGLLFVHAALVLEMVRTGAVCAGCVIVAVLAVAAASAQLVRRPSDFGWLAVGLLAGTAVGRLEAVGRAERALRPSRRLDRLPDFVDRGLLRSCGHGSKVRIVIYEKDCKG